MTEWQKKNYIIKMLSSQCLANSRNEDNSGGNVMLPNCLWQQNIVINYNKTNYCQESTPLFRLGVSKEKQWKMVPPPPHFVLWGVKKMKTIIFQLTNCIFQKFHLWATLTIFFFFLPHSNETTPQTKIEQVLYAILNKQDHKILKFYISYWNLFYW